MQTTSRSRSRSSDRRPSRGLPVAFLVAAVAGGGLFLAPAARADTTPTTAITGTPPEATRGYVYNFQFGTEGFTAPVTFTVESGTPPHGINFYSYGLFNGVPDQAGAGSPILIRASDGGVDPDATVSVTIPVNLAPPTWSGTAPANSSTPAGAPYYVRYATYYSDVPITLSVSDGLPPGLTFDEYGEIQGTPTTPGTYTFTVTASNGSPTDTTFTQTLTVTGSSPSISGDAPDTVQGESYDYTYTFGGPPAPTTTKVISGNLPDGLSLGGDGHLTGTVYGAPGVYTFTVAADNVVGPEATEDDTITVGQDPLSITGTPPAAGVGEPYDFTFDTEGNGYTGTYLSGGTLPRGLELWNDELTGTPTRAGTYAFTVVLFDLYGNTATEDVTMQVLPKPQVSIAGTRAWEGNSGTTPMSFTVTLSRASTLPVTVHWATGDGTATAGSDYQASSGDVTFDPGQTSATVTVPIVGDSTKEGGERFAVRLSRPTNASLGTARAWGRILDDDRPGLTF